MTPDVTLREATPADVDACARIVFDAFADIHDHHRFERDFPTVEVAQGMMSAWIPHPSVWGVVAEREGRIVGSNFLDERDPISGVGPITVDPHGQNSGVGHRLMEAVIERGFDAPGIRLLQDGFHMRSLALYTRLGFDVKEPVVVMKGTPRSAPLDAVEVRPLEERDVDECEALCVKVHGFPRTNALRDAMQLGTPLVALREGRITAYTSALAFWPMNHGVGESVDDLSALLLGAAGRGDDAIGFLVPIRSPLFRWCLDEGLRAVKPMTVMAVGEYNEPAGAWLPSVLY